MSIAPGGEKVAGPLHRQQNILYARIDPARAASAWRTFDVAEHYARQDVLRLHVDRRRQSPIDFAS